MNTETISTYSAKEMSCGNEWNEKLCLWINKFSTTFVGKFFHFLSFHFDVDSCRISYFSSFYCWMAFYEYEMITQKNSLIFRHSKIFRKKTFILACLVHMYAWIHEIIKYTHIHTISNTTQNLKEKWMCILWANFIMPFYPIQKFSFWFWKDALEKEFYV
jgi:hypothetical protein